jgi:hypothetical protein
MRFQLAATIMALLVGLMSQTPTLAMSCSDHMNQCLSMAPTRGWSNAEAARNCNRKRMKCLNTGCWFTNGKGINQCGHSKQ